MDQEIACNFHCCIIDSNTQCYPDILLCIIIDVAHRFILNLQSNIRIGKITIIGLHF